MIASTEKALHDYFVCDSRARIMEREQFDSPSRGLHVVAMTKVEEMTERDRKAAEVLRELEALPPGQVLTRQELVALLRRMPGLPEGWSSAEYIREFRGPLPEDDPDFQHDGRD